MRGSAAPLVPRSGTRSLSELVPSLLSSLGLAGFAGPLALEPAARVCLLMVDGLGWDLLRANREAAPFLNSIAGKPLTAGFPATTAASLSSLATGLPPGEHGLIGYTMALPGYERAFNTLTWSLYGLGPRVDLREALIPEAFQPHPTLAERGAAAGIPIYYLGPAFHEGSGLSRAIGRGQRFHPAESLEAIQAGALRRLTARPALVYGDYSRLDAGGHIQGGASGGWREGLMAVGNGGRTLAAQP